MTELLSLPSFSNEIQLALACTAPPAPTLRKQLIQNALRQRDAFIEADLRSLHEAGRDLEGCAISKGLDGTYYGIVRDVQIGDHISKCEWLIGDGINPRWKLHFTVKGEQVPEYGTTKRSNRPFLKGDA